MKGADQHWAGSPEREDGDEDLPTTDNWGKGVTSKSKLSRNMKDLLRELRRHPEVRVRRGFYADLVEPKPLDQARAFPGDAWRGFIGTSHMRGLAVCCDALERRGLLEPCGWHGTDQLFQLTEAGKAVEL